MQWTYREYLVSSDPALLSIETIARFLADSYWAHIRSLETIRKSVQNSLCFGAYLRDEQVGFARVVTDQATFFWLCDVYIDREHRGVGLGKFLVHCALSVPELLGLRGMLATKDAHALYAHYGFEIAADPRQFMTRSKDAQIPKFQDEGESIS
jgi:GNAT superfamily N-acetyltransferase